MEHTESGNACPHTELAHIVAHIARAQGIRYVFSTIADLVYEQLEVLGEDCECCKELKIELEMLVRALFTLEMEMDWV